MVTFRWSRFDRAVAVALAVLALLTGLLIWRGSRLDETALRAPRVLYLGEDESGQPQLWAVSPEGGDPAPLTRETWGVDRFAVAPGADRVAYVTRHAGGESEIWSVARDGSGRARLLTCEDADCGELAWSPDGRQIVYTRRDHAPLGDPAGAPRLWQIDVASGTTAPLFDDPQIRGQYASWSPDGAWLAYVEPGGWGAQAVHAQDGRRLAIPGGGNLPPVWHPQEDVLLVIGLELWGGRVMMSILRADLDAAQVTNLSGDELLVEDSAPAWSPDGEWIVFGRRPAGVWSGQQLWLMRADGSDARALTDDPEVYHSTPAWRCPAESTDGYAVLFTRFVLADPQARPEVWSLEIETGVQRRIAAPGREPAWLP